MEESTIKSTLISPEIAATDKVSEESPLKSTAISQKKDLESANDRKIADDEVQDIQETKDTLHTDNGTVCCLLFLSHLLSYDKIS